MSKTRREIAQEIVERREKAVAEQNERTVAALARYMDAKGVWAAAEVKLKRKQQELLEAKARLEQFR